MRQQRSSAPLWLIVLLFSGIFVVSVAYLVGTRSAQQTWLARLEVWQTGLGAYLGLLGLMFVEAIRRTGEIAHQARLEQAAIDNLATLLWVEVGGYLDRLNDRARMLNDWRERASGSTGHLPPDLRQYRALILPAPEIFPLHSGGLAGLGTEIAKLAGEFYYETSIARANIEVMLDPGAGGPAHCGSRVDPVTTAHVEIVLQDVDRAVATGEKLKTRLERILNMAGDDSGGDGVVFACTWTGICPFDRTAGGPRHGRT